MILNAFIIQDAARGWFGKLGYAVGYGPQSRTLADLRDTLLPKLLSGELSVWNHAPVDYAACPQ